MKPAAANDIWRDLRKSTKLPLRTLRLAWKSIPRLPAGAIEIRQPFVIICGENGVGKSTILYALFNALVAAERRQEAVLYVRPEEAEVDYVSLEVYERGVGPRSVVCVQSIRELLAPDGLSLRVSFVDPAAQVPALLGLIRGDRHFDEVLEPFDAQALTPDELSEVSFVVGRNYDAVDVTEVEGVAGFGTFPYFRATVSGVSYGSEDMGAGELSILLMYWHLRRAGSESILLLEEPETFVAPRSQRRLTDVVARFALEKHLKVIATTHSPMVAARFLREEMILVSRDGLDVTIAAPPPPGTVDRRLELLPLNRVVWLVEDQMAARILTSFLVFGDLIGHSEVVVVGSNDAVVNFIESTKPRVRPSIVLAGVLDGDEKPRRQSVPPCVTFLPGNVSPEAFLRSFLHSKSTEEWTDIFGKDAVVSALARGAVAGTEDHEWAHALRRELGVSLDELVGRAAERWIYENEGPSENFVDGLRRIAGI